MIVMKPFSHIARGRYNSVPFEAMEITFGLSSNVQLCLESIP